MSKLAFRFLCLLVTAACVASLAIVLNGRAGPTEGPAEAVLAASSTVSLSAGGQTTCETRADGTAWCWGRNNFGQVGDRTTETRPAPTQLPGRSWKRISTSGATTCAIKTDGTLWCWGLNNFGQVGVRRSPRKLKPLQVGTATTWLQVATGWGHTCGIQSPGTLWCWGQNGSGQVGAGRTSRQIARPTKIGTVTSWTSVTVGGWHTCGTRSDRSAWCWGRNTFGQLGRNFGVSKSAPVQLGRRPNWGTLSAGWGHTCATRTSTGLKCWGYNAQGQLGDGSRVTTAKPQLIANERKWVKVSVGDANTCALDDSGRPWCWGGNRYRQLGSAATSPTLTPVRSDASSSMTSLAAGWLHVCASGSAEGTRCWGNNEEGQLGTGTISRSGSALRAALAKAPAYQAPDSSALTPGEVADQAIVGRPTVLAKRATRKAWKLRLMTFNVLGTQHTSPGGARPDYAPGRLRAEWSTTLIASKRVSLIGLQEVQPDQLVAFESANPGRFGFYPGTSLGYVGAPQSVAWRKSRWTLVWKNTVTIPFVDTERPQPVVRLRDKKTGEDFYWINAHFSPQGMERDRDRATKIVIALVRKLQKDGLPILLTGDFNEHREIFCKVTRKTDLLAANGGSNAGRGKCKPPRQMRVDWIFASGGDLRRLKVDQGAEVRRITDHAVLTSKLVGP